VAINYTACQRPFMCECCEWKTSNNELHKRVKKATE